MNANNDAVETEYDVNANDDAVEAEDDANTNNDVVESVDAANANDDAVAPKYAADTHADANDPSGDESSTDNAADCAAIISVDNLTAAIAPPSPMPTRPAGTSAIPSRWPPLCGPLNPTPTTCDLTSECPTRPP